MKENRQSLYLPQMGTRRLRHRCSGKYRRKTESQVVDHALSIVEKLEHRAGKDAAGETGDGVGIMTQIPHPFFSKAAAALGIELGEPRAYGVGMFFFPQNTLALEQAKKMLEIIAAKEGVTLLG